MSPQLIHGCGMLHNFPHAAIPGSQSAGRSREVREEKVRRVSGVQAGADNGADAANRASSKANSRTLHILLHVSHIL